MSTMKKLLESMDAIAGSNPGQKEGDQVRGTEKATPRGDGKHPFQDRLVGEADDFLGKPYRRGAEQIDGEIDGEDEVVGEDEELASITEELRQAFEDYVGDPYSDNNVIPKSTKKPGKDVPKPKVQKVKDPKMVEAKGKSENRELWDRIKSRGTVPGIDKERYTDLSHEGLEGPFRQKNGQVLYYDPKAGQYYNRDTDMYIDSKDQEAMNEAGIVEGDPDIPFDTHMAMKEKERAAFRDNYMRGEGDRRRQAIDRGIAGMNKNKESNPFKPEVEEGKAAKLKGLKAKFESIQGKLAGLKKAKSLKEAPIDQTVAQPQQNAAAANAAQQPAAGQPAAPGPQGQQPAGQQPAPAAGQQPAAGPAPAPATPGTPAPKPAAGAPATTAQQAPAPAGAKTVAPAPGQPTPPAAGQPGGAPVKPAAGTPAPVQGNASASTTPMQNLSQTISQLASDPAAAKQAAMKLGNVAK